MSRFCRIIVFTSHGDEEESNRERMEKKKNIDRKEDGDVARVESYALIPCKSTYFPIMNDVLLKRIYTINNGLST